MKYNMFTYNLSYLFLLKGKSNCMKRTLKKQANISLKQVNE